MREIKVKISNGTELSIRQSYRTLILFEAYRFKTIENISTTEDLMYWLYCTLISCNRDTFDMSFDAFLDMMDNNVHLLEAFNEFNANVEVMPNDPADVKEDELDESGLKKR